MFFNHQLKGINQKKYDIVISGSGPAGLVTAYEFTERGYSVLVIDSRGESIRPQLVYINDLHKEYFKRMVSKSTIQSPEDQAFLHKLDIDREHFNIKDIERFIKRRLTNRKNYTYLPFSTISKIDMEKGKLDIQSKSKPTQSVEFVHLIGADGAKHPTADILKKMGYETGYHPIPSHKLKRNITAYFTIKPYNPPIELPPYLLDVKLIDMDRNVYFYVEKSSHEKSNGKKLKACFTMSLPKELYKKWEKDLKEPMLAEKTREVMKLEIEKYIKKYYYPEASVIFTKTRNHKNTQKDQLKILLFKSKLFEADKAAILVNDHIYARVGDALRIPDFYLGHGVGSGIDEAIKLAKLVHAQSESNAIEAYNTFFRVISDEVMFFSRTEEERLDDSINEIFYKELKKAFKNEDKKLIHTLLHNKQFNHEKVDESGNNLLHYLAIYASSVTPDRDTVRILIEKHKVNPNKKNHQWLTPLEIAMTQSKCNEMIEELRYAILKELQKEIFERFPNDKKSALFYETPKQTPSPIIKMLLIIVQVEANILTVDSALEEIIRIGKQNSYDTLCQDDKTSKELKNLQMFFNKFRYEGEYTAHRLLGKDVSLAAACKLL